MPGQLGGDGQPIEILDDVNVDANGYSTAHLFGDSRDFGFEFPDDWSVPSPAGDSHDPLHGAPELLPSAWRLDGISSWEPISETTEPTVPERVHDAMFARALLTNCRTSSITFPWEQGIYTELFSDEPGIENLVPTMQISDFCNFGIDPEPHSVAQVVADVATCSDPRSIFSVYVACSDEDRFQSKQTQIRNAAICKLLVVVNHDLEASSTGRHILALGTESQSSEDEHAIMDAVVGIRSPATLMKRANSLLSFLRWFASSGIVNMGPFNEQSVWMFMSFLKESSAPATKGESTMSALRFAHFVLGFDTLGPVLSSRRLVDCVRSCWQAKGC